MQVLLNDTTQTGTPSGNSPKFSVTRGEPVALRSTRLDGSAVVNLYYYGPDGTFNQAVDDSGAQVTLTPTNPERLVNIPGTYTVAVTAAATTRGVVFVDN